MVSISARMNARSFCEDSMVDSLGRDVLTSDFRQDYVPICITGNKSIPYDPRTLWNIGVDSLNRLQGSIKGDVLWGFTGHVVSIRYNFLSRGREKAVSIPAGEVLIHGYYHHDGRLRGKITFVAEKETFEKIREELSWHRKCPK